ncbi:MAG: hypothetical protein PHD82_04265 [Candidatus Riflebacteria bacterium]|nr:hypothetical protein [Candidatus Riflebacteria bacterium]
MKNGSFANSLFTVLAVLSLLTLSVRADCTTWQVVTEGSGLCGRSVNCFAVYKNTMAVGTENGVSVYDGNSCTWATLKLPDEIASLSVCDMAIDEHGHYWLATNQGLVTVQGTTTYVYDTSHNLPTVDINRVQIQNNQVFAGCFGGYICSAFLPQSGMTKFSPVNYQINPDSGSLKIRSVGISAMAMQANFKGWVSTLGNGLIEISGSNEFCVKDTSNQPENWVNDFYIFHEGKSREMRTLAVTPEHLSLIKNNQAIREIQLPLDDQWLNCVVTVREDPEYYDWVELPEMSGDEEFLNDFIGRRTVYIGTRSSGLWRFYKGKWRQYLAENSILPSNCINRLYVYKKLLLVCTDAGLVMVHLSPDRYDEFQETGVGTRYNKTFFPFLTNMVYFQVVKGSSYWISHQFGLTRWKTNDRNTYHHLEQKVAWYYDLSTRIEPAANPEREAELLAQQEIASETENSKVSLNFANDEEQLQELEVGRYWEHYTNKAEFSTASNAFPIPYQEITSMTVDRSTDYLWLIFAGQHLARMRMVRRIVMVDGKKQTVERPDWQMLEKFVPWNDGERLNVVWFNAGKIYIGTHQGFYILENPESENLEKFPFAWQHYGVFQGLAIPEVRGFAFWNPRQGKCLAIMHNQNISTWDGNDFSMIDLDGDCTCIKSGSDGNLWIGSTKGLHRIDPTGERFHYRSTNAHFMSDNITAIGVVPEDNNSVAVWVACDGFVKYSEKGQGLDGSDKMPFIYTRKDGVTVTYDDYSTSDIRFQSTSFHYYDGLTWEKWRIAGIRDILVDRNYLWTPTNVRVRRMRINHSDY